MTGSVQLKHSGNIVMVNTDLNNNYQPELLEKKYLASILLFALMINLIVWYLSRFSIDVHFQLAPFLQIDSLEYINLGKQIFENGVFPNFSRTPVYPFFIGFFDYFLGFQPSQLVLVNIVLSLLNIWLVWRLTAYFLAPCYQFLITLVFALDPVTIQVTNYVLSETLFSFLLLVGLNILANLKLSKCHWYFAVLCGLSLGLFALCRPVGQYLPILLMIWLWVGINNKNKKTLLLISVLLLFAYILVPEAWKQRNKSLTGYSFISTTTSINMYNYRAAWNVARRDGRTFVDVKQEFQENREAFARENSHLMDYEIAQHFTKEGLNIILNTPWETVQQATRGLVYLYGGIYNASIERITGGGMSAVFLKVYSIVYLLLVYIGVLFGLFFYRKLSDNQKSIFMLSAIVVAYFTFFSIGVESYARLRAPFSPYIVMISIIGWFAFYNKMLRK